MEYRMLGHSGVMVSPLCLGTMMFGDRCDEREARRIIAMARDAGVNFIDTADVYATDGESEKIVGRAISGERDQWVLATKLGNRMGDDETACGLSRRWMSQAIDDSLSRLGVDYVDIYYLHREDADTPLEETVAAMGEVIAAGKACYFGLSNFRAWRHAEVVRLCDAQGVPRPVISQPYYNAFNRMPEVELLPACAQYDMAVASYSPVARGVLTGKYLPGDTPPESSRAGSGDKRIMESEFRPESIALVPRIKEHAEALGVTVAQFAFAWVIHNRLVTAAIAGPRTADQCAEYIAALEVSLGAEDEALIDELVPLGHPSSPGYSDPKYPIEGRIPRHV
jgi:aryl-alcohol dehydrogenase-like predicted oxidoreductase